MNYKISGGIRRNRKVFIIGIVLWALLTIVLVLPFTYSSSVAVEEGQFNLMKFMEEFAGNIASPGKTISYIFSNGLVGKLMSNWFGLTLIYLFCCFCP